MFFGRVVPSLYRIPFSMDKVIEWHVHGDYLVKCFCVTAIECRYRSLHIRTFRISDANFNIQYMYNDYDTNSKYLVNTDTCIWHLLVGPLHVFKSIQCAIMYSVNFQRQCFIFYFVLHYGFYGALMVFSIQSLKSIKP